MIHFGKILTFIFFLVFLILKYKKKKKDPFPTTNRFFLLMTLFNHKPVKYTKINFENLSKIVI